MESPSSTLLRAEGAKLVRLTVVALAVFLGLATLAYVPVAGLFSLNERVDYHHEQARMLQQFLQLAEVVQSAQENYILSSDRGYLELHETGRTHLEEVLASLKRNPGDIVEEHVLLAELVRREAAWRRSQNATLEAHFRDAPELGVLIEQSQLATASMEAVAVRLQRSQAEQDLPSLRRQFRNRTYQAYAAFLILLATAVWAGLRYSRRITHEVAARQLSERALQALNSELDSRVAERTKELRASEARLKKSAVRLRLSQQYGEIGTWEADLVHGREVWSETTSTILGFPAGRNHAWKDYLAVILPEDRQLVIDAVQANLENNVPYDAEYRITDIHGQIRWMRSAGKAERDAHGKPVRMLGIVQDITRRKEHELALAEAKKKLEAAFHTLALSNEQLAAANRSRSEFLASVSHELKTPLNHIIGFSDLIKEGIAGPVSEKQRGFLQDIYDSGIRLLGLISDIIDFAHLEAGHEGLDLVPEDVGTLLSQNYSRWRERASSTGLVFELIAPETLGSVWLDVAKVQKIVDSLLSNAVKFTPAGGSVTLSARRVNAAQVKDVILPPTFESYLEIVVRDTGIGFQAEAIPRLFHPFHQADAGMDRHYGGVGLGLAMAKGLVELLGGRIKAANVSGGGACVSVWLPWREHADEPVNLATDTREPLLQVNRIPVPHPPLRE